MASVVTWEVQLLVIMLQSTPWIIVVVEVHSLEHCNACNLPLVSGLKKSENFDLQSEAMASSQTSLRATCQGCNSLGLGMSRAAVGKSKQGRLSL